ncbi:ATP-dependent 6-phosphofructokinase [Fulvivirga sp. 29W222]|uniref:ATP-dependent 6-phosphofructokinase n=1 Tax=Fulvivirga marina TaxID=2494733 RepID=A0A937KDG7_9BACT|nr:ATP-dependent 6-phosphofructokinase [Fulvivirga marina]MBL6446045.1 ATP-dependent 6-phosphofructokinase [Fulvivirga marina]
MAKRKVLVLTGGGDCPGLNAVIRGIVKRAKSEKNWEIIGSMEAFNGVLRDPVEIMELNDKVTAGIHVKGGTILKTTNKGNPLEFPVQQKDGSWSTIDRSKELIDRINSLGVDSVISIGGDGSQRISQRLYEQGLNIVGVPKTIDNDLSGTDFTFGFRTAVQIATDSFDKLVSTAESHHRVMIMEVMGRDAGWIALHTAIAGGAEVCLIPEIPYDINKVVERLNQRYDRGKGFAHIVIAEGARPIKGEVTAVESEEVGYEHKRLGGVAYQLSEQLRAAGCEADIRETVLGHTQRGGTPIAFDRILATLFGVKAFELVLEGEFGKMVSFKNNKVTSVSIEEAISKYNYVNKNSFMVRAARSIGISFGD